MRASPHRRTGGSPDPPPPRIHDRTRPCGSGTRSARARGVLPLLGALLLAPGCAVVRLPDGPPAADLERLASAAGSLGAVTAADEYRTDAQALAGVLSGTGLFSEVRVAFGDAEISESDWVVSSQVELPFSEPMLTVLSLGVIPHPSFGEARRTYSFTPAAPSTAALRSVTVVHDRDLIFGWLGLPLTLLPGWTLEGSDAHDRRLGELLGAALLSEGLPTPH